MAQTTRVMLDGFNYDVERRDVPRLTDDGQIVEGELVPLRVLRLASDQTMVEAFFTQEQFEVFVDRMVEIKAAGSLTIATHMPAGDAETLERLLRNRNGG